MSRRKISRSVYIKAEPEPKPSGNCPSEPTKAKVHPAANCSDMQIKQEPAEQQPGPVEIKKVPPSGSDEVKMEMAIESEVLHQPVSSTVHKHAHKDSTNELLESSSQYCCEVCNRYFNTVSALATHAQVHDRAHKIDIMLKHWKFTCLICKKDFATELHLENHIQNYLTGKNEYKRIRKRFTCDICKSAFTHKGNLGNHIKFIHDRKKSFSCVVCKRKFSQRHHLKRHSIVHSGK